MVSQKNNSNLLVGIFNTSVELIEALELAMEQEGFTAVSATVTDLKRHKITLEELFPETPDIVLYDVGLPYKENWEFLKILEKNPIFQKSKIFITTTNRKALEELVKENTHAFEITGVWDRPFNLDELLEAIRKSLA